VIYGEIKPFVLNIFSQENFVFLLSKIANAILRFTGKKLCFPALQKLPEQFLDGGNLFKHRAL